MSFPPPGPPPGFPPHQISGAYPGTLPPPVQYPRRRRWPLVAAIVGVIAVIAAAVGIVVVVTGRQEPGTPITAATAKPAIQEFLDALADGDQQTIARHTLCGLYDAVRNHDSDLALADMSGDAFRRQYKRVQVTSIDKIVYLSPTQAQVLFSMKGTPAPSGRMPAAAADERQAVAQVLAQDGKILVCSYVQRTE